MSAPHLTLLLPAHLLLGWRFPRNWPALARLWGLLRYMQAYSFLGSWTLAVTNLTILAETLLLRKVHPSSLQRHTFSDHSKDSTKKVLEEGERFRTYAIAHIFPVPLCGHARLSE